MLPTIDLSGLLIQVIVAIAAGGLIGLERERRPTRKYAGLRTLALLCGTGPIVVTIATEAGAPLLIGVYFLLAGAISLFIAFTRIVKQQHEVGFTTSVTVFLVAAIGILIGFGFLSEAVVIAIITAIILSEKERLHSYVDRLSQRDLTDSLTLIAIIFIIYPIVPAEPIDPFDILVPREVVLFVIFVLTIQFASYILMRQLGGSKGLALTGILAGGANSFATAGVLARLERREEGALRPISAALVLATMAMILRNVGIATILAVGIVWSLWQPTLAMLLVSIAIVYHLWEGEAVLEGIDERIESPFSLRAAVMFAAMYIAILVTSVFANETVGDAGLFVTAFLGGLVSSAAVAVTAATVLNDGVVGVEPAAAMVVLGIVASLTSKIIVIRVINRRLLRTGAIPLVIIGVFGILVFVLT